jgi:3-hydroxyacyl-CoA dehydrogenase/enoyl-CoA hydratase/3-hydroxybutyryl-CoA epimerase
MPLVEVVAGERSSPEAVSAVGRLAVRLGKTPVFVQNCPGFLVNRLLMPYLNEAVLMAEEGADFTKVDRLVKDFGMPMGPFTLLDEVGIDVGREVATTLHGAYGERMRTGRLFALLAEAGEAGAAESSVPRVAAPLLGKKNGHGFYLYAGAGGSDAAGSAGGGAGGEQRGPNPDMRRLLDQVRAGGGRVPAGRGAGGENVGAGRGAGEAGGSAGVARLSDFDTVHRPILTMLNEASRALEERVVESPGELDLALVLGTGFAPFRGGLLRYVDDELGIARAHELLSDYAERFGERFIPAPLVDRLAREGRGYYQAARDGDLHEETVASRTSGTR